MKKAFTLIELLVVVGILGILVTVTLVAMSGGTESAQNVKCETNMRNLAAACQTYGMANGHFPLAGSVEKMGVNDSQGVKNLKEEYWELPGWLSWYSNDAYRSRPSSHTASAGWFTSAYEEDEDVRRYCMTNGVLWKYVSANKEIYRCPFHVNKFPQHPPAWSYVMNSYFGWDNSEGARAKGKYYYGIEYLTMPRADRRLLFAEIPFMGVEREANTSSSSGKENDCVLQYKDTEGAEVIGFNHRSGKRDRFAMVVFADAHTERISWPRNGLDDGNVRDLTKWLCEGKDVVFDGKHRYEEAK